MMTRHVSNSAVPETATGAESCFFFFQAEDGIRDYKVTGVQTCALPIYASACGFAGGRAPMPMRLPERLLAGLLLTATAAGHRPTQIGRASGRGRGEISGGAGSFKKKKSNYRCDQTGTQRVHMV